MKTKKLKLTDENFVEEFNSSINSYDCICVGEEDLRLNGLVTIDNTNSINNKAFNTKLLKTYNLKLTNEDLQTACVFFLRKIQYLLRLQFEFSDYELSNDLDINEVLMSAVSLLEYITKYIPSIPREDVAINIFKDLFFILQDKYEDIRKDVITSLFISMNGLIDLDIVLGLLKKEDSELSHNLLEVLR